MTKICFDLLKVGDIFKCDEGIFMKVTEFENDYDFINAVNLANGYLTDISGDVEFIR